MNQTSNWHRIDFNWLFIDFSLIFSHTFTNFWIFFELNWVKLTMSWIFRIHSNSIRNSIQIQFIVNWIEFNSIQFLKYKWSNKLQINSFKTFCFFLRYWIIHATLFVNINEKCKNEINNCVYNCVDDIFKLYQKFNMNVDFVVFENFTINSHVSKFDVINDNLIMFENLIVDRIVSKSNLMKISKTFFDSSNHIDVKIIIEKTKKLSKFVVVENDSNSTKKNFFVESIKSSYKLFVFDNIKNNERLTTKNKRFFENESQHISCDILIKIVKIIVS